MIGDRLNEINDVEGVEGVMVTTNVGRLVEKVGIETDLPRLETVAKHLLRVVASYHVKDRQVKEVELVWNNYRVIAVPRDDFLIMTFCDSSKALPLIRITLNVVLSQLLEDKKFIKSLRKQPAYRTAVLKDKNLIQKEINLISKLQ